MYRTLFLAVLLLPACVSGGFEPTLDDSTTPTVQQEEGVDGFGDDTRPYDGPVGGAPEDDENEDEKPIEGDDDDIPDVPVEEEWDSAPPEGITDGSLMHVDMTCALLDGPHTKTYRYETDHWVEISGTGSGLFSEFQPCVGTARERVLTWEGPDAMYILAGGMHHDLWPTETQDHWLGEVYLDDGTSSQRCLDALDAAGLSWPVMMSLTVTDIEI